MDDDARRLRTLEYLYHYTTTHAWENMEKIAPYIPDNCSLYAHGPWKFQPQVIQRIRRWFYNLLPYGTLYGSEEHPLVFDFQRFLFQKSSTISEIQNISFIERLRGLEIQLRGLYLQKDGIYFCAYPRDDGDYIDVCCTYATYKDKWIERWSKDGIEIKYVDSKYPFLVVPLFHFTSVPPKDVLDGIQKHISRWSECFFGTFLPTRWTFSIQDQGIAKHVYLPKIIAHRALHKGPNHDLENTVEEIEKNIRCEIVSEVDIWKMADGYYLGHDAPTYKIGLSWILEHKKHLFIHAKNVEAFAEFQKLQARDGVDLHYFFHTTENVVFTSKGYVVPYVGEDVHDGWIYMMPERTEMKKMKSNCGAGMLCSDYKDIQSMF